MATTCDTVGVSNTLKGSTVNLYERNDAPARVRVPTRGMTVGQSFVESGIRFSTDRPCLLLGSNRVYLGVAYSALPRTSDPVKAHNRGLGSYLVVSTRFECESHAVAFLDPA